MENDNEIYFYGLFDRYNYMSNFYKSEFIDEDNIKYICNEQYFMYHKCLLFDSLNKELLNNILKEKTASEIKKLGRKVKNFDQNKWNEKKYNIMLNGLRLKFNQNADIKEKLLETNNKILYEASKYDNIWGIGYYARDAINKDKSKFGQNLLGKALMEIRKELKN